FPHVYLTGLEDGVFPSYMNITSDDPSELEEERRLCYVGITRAMDELTITCARQRMVRGETQYNAPSRFVKEIPQELMDMKIPGVRLRDSDMIDPSVEGYTKEVFVRKPYAGTGGAFPAAKPAALSAKDRNSYAKPFIATANKSVKPAIALGKDVGTQGGLDYGVGDKVRHVKFGEGVVKKIDKGARDYEVTVDFAGYGTKKMFAGFAKLKKL
ncbi:MAG: ATP-dependent DNA helicase PcrA, partial [Lachnospiraceae bacterium]|nr:ATP-dependent DNA helicase PcrA [Lachnospiraceae bacterium]